MKTKTIRKHIMTGAGSEVVALPTGSEFLRFVIERELPVLYFSVPDEPVRRDASLPPIERHIYLLSQVNESVPASASYRGAGRDWLCFEVPF